ncbi:hypothetical protein D6D19_09400 [Aureobasidium pullulans]|uniref:Heterokaryon incompatibility domain-containing protein n=1 Tax=Aureobasidium pullulans TaxID=5580 RepID=A0A4V4JUY0_AURPU|nr:hypothetical protein D6D19_09400 [Aureobasidium pullulans]THY23323.1 hypothetical protein D6D00_06325 [Aureobasidium pullulans]
MVLLMLIRELRNVSTDLDEQPSKFSSRSLRYARNELDQKRKKTNTTAETKMTSSGVTDLFEATRLVLPRRLVMYADKSWILAKDPPPTTEYVFISWHWASFKYDKNRPRREALATIKKMARHATLEAGLKAYWLDVQCVADEISGESPSSDVYGMTDVVRNAHHVAIMLPSEHSFHKREWARRLWTLPEGMLAKGRLRIWTTMETGFTRTDLDRIEMTYEFWRPFENDERHYPARILAEYFENHIELSHLEMVITAIAALSRQDSSNFTQADIAYALMGLLRRKITVNAEDTLFQAMAKLLSLTGENEYVLERMLSSYAYPAKDGKTAFRGLLSKDQFGTHLWDVRPLGEIVGVDDLDGVIYLNDCRTLPILHQRLPDQTRARFNELRPSLFPALLLLGLLLLFGLVWALSGWRANIVYTLLACTSALIATSGAELIEKRFLEEGLVLIEGTLPLPQLEKLIFGIINDSLSYAVSSSPLTTQYHEADPTWLDALNLRRWTKELYAARAFGSDPEWISPTKPGNGPASPVSPISPLLRRTSMPLNSVNEAYHPPLFSGHTLFTFICMATKEVSLVQARRPPSTLLMTGTEGGMLRVVLCSSMFDQDGREVLQKEAVVRLRPEMWDLGTSRSWLRVKMMNC